MSVQVGMRVRTDFRMALDDQRGRAPAGRVEPLVRPPLATVRPARPAFSVKAPFIAERA